VSELNSPPPPPDDPSLAPDPVNTAGVVFFTEDVLAPPDLLPPPVSVVSPTGACSSNCFGKMQEQQTPISASLLTYAGIVLPSSFHVRAFAK
jgi:hypothetical protein